MTKKVLHLNPDTGKVGRCKAEKQGCRFTDPSDPNGGHYETIEEMDAYRERRAELESKGLETGLEKTPTAKPTHSGGLTHAKGKGLTIYRNSKDEEVLEQALFSRSQAPYSKSVHVKPIELKGFNYYSITGGPGAEKLREQLESQGYSAISTHSGNVLISEKSLHEPTDVKASRKINWLNSKLIDSIDNPLEATGYIDKVFGAGATRAFYKKANVHELFRDATSPENQETKEHFSDIAKSLSEQQESLEIDFSNERAPLSEKTLKDVDKFGEDLLQSKREEIVVRGLDPDWNDMEFMKGKSEYESMKQNISRTLAGLAGYKKDSDIAQSFYSNYAKSTGLEGMKPDKDNYPMTSGYPVPSGEIQEGLKGLASYYQKVNQPDNKGSEENFSHDTPLGKAITVESMPFGKTIIRNLDISSKKDLVRPVFTQLSWKDNYDNSKVKETLWERGVDNKERILYYDTETGKATLKDVFPNGARAFRSRREPDQEFTLQDSLPKDYTEADMKNFLVSESIRQNFGK